MKTKIVLINIGGLLLILLLLSGPIKHIIKNHPYEYVYFNELVGGTKNAYGNYEMDYYYHSTREASEWIIANAKNNNSPSADKIKVATWHTASVNYFFSKDTTDFQVLFSRWYERGNTDWDYAIFTITGMEPSQIKNSKIFPPKNCVHTIEVDGKPICLILKREDKSDYWGFYYRNKSQIDSTKIDSAKIDSAKYYFKKALDYDPYNESVLINMSEIYLGENKLDSAKQCIDNLLFVIPENHISNFYLAYYFAVKNEFDKAIKTCNYVISVNPKFVEPYHLLAKIYLAQKDLKSAEKVLLELMDFEQFNNQSVEMLIQIYQYQGLSERASYRKMYKKFADSYKKKGKKKEYQEYYDMYKSL